MSRLRVESFTISLDGYGAGPGQSLQHPMGTGTEQLHAWAFATRTFRAMFGQEGGSEGADEAEAARGFDNIGAWVMGRNMFTHERGPWSDPDWRGWWGDVPPYHCDVFVLTHHARDPLAHGGTTFHFVTGGLAEAVDRAKDAAGGRDVRLGGGVAALRDGFAQGLIDTAHLAVAPILLGSGEALFAGLDLPALGYAVTGTTAGEIATHVHIGRAG
ncbi:dihydrofolate reductase [Rhodobacterales bacterium HKCCE2091]|nr:dihydrofolate reductase [Rhodobacterales bacterium HKCCE2091]